METTIKYCNIVVYGDHDIGKAEFIRSFMTDPTDLVLPNWWAKEYDGLKVNVWHIDSQHSDQLQKTHINAVLLCANLSDPKVISRLDATYQDITKSRCLHATTLVVVGLSRQQSGLTETFRVRVLEWSAQQTGDLAFIEANLNEIATLNPWREIINHVVSQSPDQK